MTRKSNTRMCQKKRERHRRLRRFRDLIDLTQKELADLCGCSEPYILSVEIGQRRMTPFLAEKICVATDVGPLWLLGKEGNSSEPLTLTGAPYRPEDFQSKRKRVLKRDIEPSEDQVSDIHHFCHVLTQLMQAACRQGWFPMAKYYFREMTDAMIQKLQLKGIIANEHLRALERYLFPLWSDESIHEEHFDRLERDELWRLMSPTGSNEWADAVVGTKTERDNFKDQLDRLRDLVEASFSSRPPRTAKSSTVLPTA
jgi:transcriptional regulator with XRE-family HTH domain